ncbi:c-type cytochrome [Luteolibacter sp. GHJ8]|uniref:C-type cytochrome n=1 Tax=Luteolibacter rhizosphaerae TaxID=2989719 RepID=A0ABT3G5L4_9BACT|nr:c-type cytochrome [Luteolibacter rhizosphaerae]MCW1914859.1 c-type cytochrome [Luteolibacter rhizosphaerae]
MHRPSIYLLPLAAAGSAMALPQGFEMKEFAGPPNADYPAAITAAANGDVYVSSDQNGSLGHKPKMGRIIRCRDTDGDGKADNFVHFVKDVDSPRGGHLVGDTLYLIHPPFLSSFRDTDGDGEADEKKVLVTGLGGGIEHPRGADHTTNGVRMGIDGWLYISVGDFGTTPAKGTDGSEYTLHGGGVIRVRPDGSQVEPYAVMLRNICDTAISPELDMFSRDNTNDGKGWNTRFHHYTALGDHGYPRLYKNFADEAIKPLADYGGGSGTGALWLSEPGFPPEFTDALFSTDWTTGTVHYHPWKKEGASFKVEQKDFEKLPRATDIDVDGNSKLYLADWRDGGFDYTPDKKVGKIFMVTYPGATPAKYTDVTKAKDDELVKLLASASAVQRLETQREIVKRGKKPPFAEGIFAIAKDSKQTAAVRAAAIFTFKQLYGKGSTKYLSELVADETVREFALRAMTDRKSELEGVDAKTYVTALQDKNPRVVLQALVGLERLKAKDAAPAIFSASSGWREEGFVSPRLEHTAMQVLASLENIPACLKATNDTATRKLAMRALSRIHKMEVVDGLITLVAKSNDYELKFEALAALARLNYTEKKWNFKDWWSTQPDDRGPYYDPVEWDGSGKIRAAIEKGFGSVPQARQNDLLDLLGKNRLPVAQMKLSGADPLLVALESKELNNTQLMLLVDAAKDGKRPFAQRADAYKALSKGGEDLSMPYRLAVLAVWSQEKESTETSGPYVADFVNASVRGEQVRALREIAAKQGDSASRIAWKALLTVLNSPLAKDEAKKRVQQEVDKNPKEVGFFQAIADLKLTGFDKQIEAGINWDSSKIIDAAKAAKTAVAAGGAGGKKVAELAVADVAKTAMDQKGDVATGQRLFTSQGCIACHSIDPKAEQKGPYLGAAGAKFTRDYLVDSILEPNKVVAQGFQTAMFNLKDGTAKMGFVTGEADGIVEIRDIAGQVSKVKREDVKEEVHMPQSMMPPGLAGTLTVEEFTSLIEYLVSLRATGG